jgi:hypothetical protein
MAHPWHHAISSTKQHGGKPEDYLKIHDWFDQTKAHMPDDIVALVDAKWEKYGLGKKLKSPTGGRGAKNKISSSDENLFQTSLTRAAMP